VAISRDGDERRTATDGERQGCAMPATVSCVPGDEGVAWNVSLRS